LSDKYEHLIPIGTILSGTDGPLVLLADIQKLYLENYNITLAFEHRFSCDHKPSAEEFIKLNSKPLVMYKSLEVMTSDAPTDMYTSQPAPVPHVAILFSAVDCDNYSALNRHAPHSQGSFEESRGTSGISGRLGVRVIQLVSPLIVFTENVKGWATARDKTRPSDFAMYDSCLNHLGYHTEMSYVDAKLYYCPQSRLRIYAISIRISDTPLSLDHSPPPLMTTFHSVLTRLKAPVGSRYSIDRFMYRDDSPEVASWVTERTETGNRRPNEAKRQKPKPKSKPCNTEYMVRHL
jgi:site-specific DNA-cytosine methylase